MRKLLLCKADFLFTQVFSLQVPYLYFGFVEVGSLNEDKRIDKNFGTTREIQNF